MAYNSFHCIHDPCTCTCTMSYMQNEYGIGWNGPTGVDHETVAVPDTENPLSPAQLDLLRHTINPMEECDQYGI